MCQTHGSPKHQGHRWGYRYPLLVLASHLEESFPFVEILIWKWALGTEESPEPTSWQMALPGTSLSDCTKMGCAISSNTGCCPWKSGSFCFCLPESWDCVSDLSQKAAGKEHAVVFVKWYYWSSYSLHWREMLLWILLIFSEEESEFSVFSLHDI